MLVSGGYSWMTRTGVNGTYYGGWRLQFYLMVPLLLLLISCFVPSSACAQVVVVNDSVDEQSISQSALRAVFTVRLQRLSGQRLEVFVLAADHPTHTRFSRQVLGAFPYQLRDAWNRAAFSGTGSTPTVLDSEEEMLHRVANTAGAIGYLSEPTDHAEIRVLFIEGLNQ